ncbi:MAG: PIN domain-containing protein [Solirubrobacterales bacterium]
MTAYVDASALVKLVVEEAESAALRPFLDGFDVLATSRVAVVEVGRAAWRHSAIATDRAAEVLDVVVLVELDATLAGGSAGVAPDSLRTLDAIHLASAQALAEDLQVFVTYDLRLAAAARALGLGVATPGT